MTAVRHQWTISGSVIALLAAAGLGVTPGVWKQDSEKDFANAQRKNIVVDSHGDVTLARAIDILLPADAAPQVISSLAMMDGAIFVGSGVDGNVDQLMDGKAIPYAKLPSTIVTCLLTRDGALLAGGGGQDAGLYEIAPDKTVKKIFSDPSVTYIWAIAPGPNESLYLATGPEAKLWRVSASGQAEAIFQADASLAKHLLCLHVKDNGSVLVGTDEKGLVFEVDPKTKTSRVVLDAAESDISVLLPDGSGGFYASTSDATKTAAQTQPTNGTKDGKADNAAESTQPKTQPAAPATPPADTPSAPDQPSEPPSNMGKPVLADASEPANPREGQDIQAQAAQADDGSITITLPAGRELPVLMHKGKPVVMIQDISTGKVQAIPAENVRVTHIPEPQDAGPADPGVAGSTPAPAPARSTPPTPNGQGNAVYHVDAAGMVHAIFRRPGTIQAMVRRGDRLMLAVGDEGKMYFVTLDGTLWGEVIDTDAKQVTVLTPGQNDSLLFATSNAGSVGSISAKPANEGTLISQPMDAKQIAQWGTQKLLGCAPDGTKLTVATRSGNLTPATDDTWSSWTKETPLQDGFTPIGAPAGRFLQYRITMTAHDAHEPTLESVETIYQVANLAPVVSAVQVTATDQGRPPAPKSPTKLYRLVAIQAGDPNNDKLVYKVQFRKAGSKVWIEIDKDLPQPRYIWDTRTVSDGVYRLRVIASDEPSNTITDAMTGSRISEPVIVDNTAPRFDNLTVVVTGGKAVLHGSVTDALSRIASLQYSVDSATKWQTFLPSDGICDSSHETFRVEVPDLPAGAHQITVRVRDVFENTGYAGQSVTVGK